MTAIRLLSLAASVFLLSEFAIGPLATSASPAPQLGPPVTVVAKTSPEDVARGKVLYEATCSKCHGLDGGGGDGPSLQGVPERLGDQATGAIIRGGIPGTGMNGFGSLNGDETGQVVGYLRTLGHTADTEVAKGDPQKGKAVYDASRCAACHIIDGVGGGIGPELTRVGAMRGPGYLHTALLAPGTNLPNEAGAMERGRFTQFLFVHVAEKNGHSVDGTRVSEDSFTIVIKDATGHFHAFRKLEVQQIDKLPGRSVMPSFKDTLSAAQLDDLVAYLASLKGAP
jgi:putative heme-binding domain-containing protein